MRKVDSLSNQTRKNRGRNEAGVSRNLKPKRDAMLNAKTTSQKTSQKNVAGKPPARFRQAADAGGVLRQRGGTFSGLLLIPAEFFLLFLGIGGHVSGTFSIQVFFAFSDRPPGTPQKQRLPVNENHNISCAVASTFPSRPGA